MNEVATENEVDFQPLPQGRATGAFTDSADDADRDGVLADLALAERCVAGEVAAWEQLYSQCHIALLAAIRKMLGPRGADFSLADEIAARVWYALVAKDGDLLKQYAARYTVRLVTFVRALAKNEIARHFRSESRLRKRERLAGTQKSCRDNSLAAESGASLSEFLMTLTPAERGFANTCLLNCDHHTYSVVQRRSSTRNYRRWATRVLAKLSDFLGS